MSWAWLQISDISCVRETYYGTDASLRENVWLFQSLNEIEQIVATVLQSQALKWQQAKLKHGLVDMTNTLTHRWKGNTNVLSVLGGCENQCRQAVVTGSVKTVSFGLYGKVYQSFTNISWTC